MNISLNAFCISIILEYLNTNELLHIAPQVSQLWSQLSSQVWSWKSAQCLSIENTENSENTLSSSIVLRCWSQMLQQFPWGRFLAEGGFKKVFEVWANKECRFEAIAVMDLQHICQNGSASVVRQEIHAGLLLSELVDNEICPHFVELYQIFQFAYDAPKHCWGSRKCRTPLGMECPYSSDSIDQNNTMIHEMKIPEPPSSDSHRAWQFLRMELCDGQDLEEYLRQDPSHQIQASQLPGIFLQMVSSLYVSRIRFGMCHYDIKLLNFLLKSEAAVQRDRRNPTPNPNNQNKTSVISYLKLADYGTVDMSEENSGKPITHVQNTPPDFLIIGDYAAQGFAADTWGLGLCLVHLLTGHVRFQH
eukprot:GSMAST32.ASY1.ANO1.1754.1 assembled CDS